MKIVFLGTNGYFPNEKRHTVCIMIPDLGFLLDVGTGFFRARNFIKTKKLHIFLSHAHQDHSIGLTWLPGVLKGKGIEGKDITIYGSHLDFPLLHKNSFIVPFTDRVRANFCEIQTYETREVEGIRVEARQLLHSVASFCSMGYRFEFPGGKTLVYVTDTVCSSTYEDFIAKADILIHECSFSDKHYEFARKVGHSWTSGVAMMALNAGVKKLILTHLDPLSGEKDPTDQKNTKVKFPDVIVAHDLMEIDL